MKSHRHALTGKNARSRLQYRLQTEVLTRSVYEFRLKAGLRTGALDQGNQPANRLAIFANRLPGLFPDFHKFSCVEICVLISFGRVARALAFISAGVDVANDKLNQFVHRDNFVLLQAGFDTDA